MFTLNDDLSIYATRGDVVFFAVSAEDDGYPYRFHAGDVVRIKVYEKKNANSVVLQKDFPVTDTRTEVGIYLDKDDTKIGDVISKHKDYWYEVVLNDDTVPQTIIGYDEDGAKLFRLFPEGADIPPYEPIKPEDIPIVDDKLDLTSHRPIENQAVTRAIVALEEDYKETKETVFTKSNDTAEALAVERSRIDNLIAHDDVVVNQELAYTSGASDKYDATITSDGVYATIKVNLREANLFIAGGTHPAFFIPDECRPIDVGHLHTEYGMAFDIRYDNDSNRYVLAMGAATEGDYAPTQACVITMTYALGDYELKDIRVGANGKRYATAGEAVRSQFNNVFERVNTISDGDLNQVVESDRYVVASSTVTNYPADITAQTKTFMLDVQRYNGRWVTQVIHQLYSSVMYFRTGSVVNYATHSSNFQDGIETSWSEWVRVDNEEYGENKVEEQIIKYQTVSQSGADLNTFNKRGNYTIAVTDSVNRPSINGGFALRVEENGSFVIQTVYGVQGNYPMFWRIGKHGTPMAWGEWFKNATSKDIENVIEQIAGLSTELGKLKSELGVSASDFYNIANMGDSIVGNVQDTTSVSGLLAKAVGANTHNFGFGGCRMSKHITPWNSFCMYKLADAIATGDFSEQEEAALNADVPSYFKDTVNAMKAIDFSTIDIMTIAYGTNDFTSAKGLDNENDLYDTNCFGGALRYSIERIGNAFPHIRFVIVAPCWRFWYDDNGQYLESSDEREVNGIKLHDFVEKCIEIGKAYHLPVVNLYDEMAINVFNRSWWFNNNDGTHPNANGRNAIAKLMANTIRGM